MIWRHSIVSQLASFYLLPCLQVFIISVLLFKRLSLLYTAIYYFSVKRKSQPLLFELKEGHIVIIFHVIFWCSMALFDFPKSFNSFTSFLYLKWLADFLWLPKRSLNVVISSDVTVNAGLINYAFCLTTNLVKDNDLYYGICSYYFPFH